MSDAYIYANFPAGVITDRVVGALSVLPASKLDKLFCDKMIVSTPKDKDDMPYGLTYYNLSWKYLDAYADASNLSLRYFLFGGTLPDVTYYSDFDRLVFSALKVIPADLIAACTDVLRVAYNSPRQRISSDTAPSAKLIALMLLGDKLPQDVPEDKLYQYSIDINREIASFRANRVRDRMVFHIDIIEQMCIFCKVSPHWVFSLHGPLLCDTPEADEFFDIFCLLSRTQQLTALSMLLSICEKEQLTLPEDVENGIRVIIAQEGRVI